WAIRDARQRGFDILRAPHQGDAPPRRLVKSGNAVEDRRLTGAVGTDKCRDLAAPDRERKISYRNEPAELHSQIFDQQQWFERAIHQPRPSLTRAPEMPFFSLR